MNLLAYLLPDIVEFQQIMIRVYSLLSAILMAVFMVLSAPPAEAQSNKALYRMARSGDVNAMRKLGVRLYDGNGVKKNVAHAVGWFEKAAARGDARSMVYLGDMYKHGKYYPKNEAKAREMYEQAAQLGDEKAKKIVKEYGPSSSSGRNNDFGRDNEEDGFEAPSGDHMADFGGSPDNSVMPSPRKKPAPAPSAPRITAPGSNKVAQSIASQVASQAVKKNVKGIAVVTFQTNGGKCDGLATNTRNLILESLINNYGESLELFDREDSKAVATESGFSMDGEQLASTQAILMAEIFHARGDDIGYISYRLFRATDTEILDAGFHRVQWSKEEKRMFSGSSSAPLHNSLPYIEKAELDKIASNFKRINSTGVAMGQSGALSADNTLQKRLAYAQIMPAILQGGGKLYEREYFVQAARESSLSDQEAMPGHAKAVGQLKSGISGNESHTYKLQISAIPQGKLLRTITFTQKAGGGAKGGGHNGENDFSDFMDALDAENRSVQLVYEYEVSISDDDYEIPEEFNDKKSSFVDRYVQSGKSPAQSILKAKVQEWYQEFNGDRKKIQQELTITAIVGCKCRIDGDWKEYLGPFGMCTMKANESIQFSDIHGGDVEHRTHFSDWREALQKNPKQGVVKYRDKPFFTYSASVEYKDGLPWLVRVRIDFTPSKNIIIKKQNKQ